jgi:hypothetical protein
MERDENGKIVADKERFPRGIKWLSDYVHSKGLKFGTYLDYGTKVEIFLLHSKSLVFFFRILTFFLDLFLMHKT